MWSYNILIYHEYSQQERITTDYTYVRWLYGLIEIYRNANQEPN